ncbi:prolyl-tRNA synthetase associated domain-containing protein [Granulosicoccus sp. 3-233]|uniref:prolyl-tRNA synthetase associated domain-containing protein n=1 Tax=Granulosicoccus sp. 3-233 TaxID=3417969 RepID=UPI003D338A97
MSHSDRPDPDAVVLANGELAASVEQVLAALHALHIEQQTISHEPLYTVDQAKGMVYQEPGAHTKNLFLRNKKGRMFLLVVEQDHTVDLRGLRKLIPVSGGQFAFASTERLGLYLGVVPGSVSPLALINDTQCKVGVYFEASVLEHEWIYLHPCRNTHSTRLRTADLMRALEAWNHPPTVLNFQAES